MKKPEMTIVTETGSEPVSVAEAKAVALIDTDADDTELGYLITTARRMVEYYINSDILPKQRKYYMPYVTDGVLLLPFAPVDTLDSVVVGSITYASDQYDVFGTTNSQIDFGFDAQNVTVTYTTSGATPDQQVKEAIKAVVEYLYNSQGVIETNDLPKSMPRHIKKMLIGQKNVYF